MASECPICYEDMSRKIATRSPCKHEVCLECLLQLEQPATCPLCRTFLPPIMEPRAVNQLIVPLTVATHAPSSSAAYRSAEESVRGLAERRFVAVPRIRFVRHGVTMTEPEGMDDAPSTEPPEGGLYEGAGTSDGNPNDDGDEAISES